HPLRLAGLLVPRAFDDAPEASGAQLSTASPYTEYFTQGDAAFADSIVLGAPALLLAAAGAFARRKGALLFSGAVLLALASTGSALGIDRILFALVPLASIFRFAEKLIAPAALWRWSRQQPATPLAAACCAASVFASCGGLLYSAPLAVVRGPFDLAERLQARAGPSQDRWRIFVNNKDPLSLSGLSARASVAASTSQALLPQFNSVARIEGMAPYFTASDPGYARGIIANPPTYFNLFGVRFVIDMPGAFSVRTARER